MVEDIEDASRKNEMARVNKLIYVLAGTGAGPKKRWYNAPPTAQPTAEEWTEELSKPPAQGSMSVQIHKD